MAYRGYNKGADGVDLSGLDLGVVHPDQISDSTPTSVFERENPLTLTASEKSRVVEDLHMVAARMCELGIDLDLITHGTPTMSLVSLMKRATERIEDVDDLVEHLLSVLDKGG